MFDLVFLDMACSSVILVLYKKDLSFENDEINII